MNYKNIAYVIAGVFGCATISIFSGIIPWGVIAIGLAFGLVLVWR